MYKIGDKWAKGRCENYSIFMTKSYTLNRFKNVN